MILTQKDKELFARLSESNYGKQLRDYLERLQADVCDSRNWSEHEDKTHANKTARVLQDDVIKHLITKKEQTARAPYGYI